MRGRIFFELFQCGFEACVVSGLREVFGQEFFEFFGGEPSLAIGGDEMEFTDDGVNDVEKGGDVFAFDSSEDESGCLLREGGLPGLEKGVCGVGVVRGV